jgi:hypothetical protein
VCVHVWPVERSCKTDETPWGAVRRAAGDYAVWFREPGDGIFQTLGLSQQNPAPLANRSGYVSVPAGIERTFPAAGMRFWNLVIPLVLPGW